VFTFDFPDNSYIFEGIDPPESEVGKREPSSWLFGKCFYSSMALPPQVSNIIP